MVIVGVASLFFFQKELELENAMMLLANGVMYRSVAFQYLVFSGFTGTDTL